MDPTPIALLSGAVASLSGVAVFLFLRYEKATKDYVADLKAEHGKRIEDKDKATAALLAQTDRMHSQLDRMADLLETTSGKRTP